MSFGYRERHTKTELVPCLTFMLIICIAGVIVIDTGLTSTNGETEDLKYDIRIELYSTEYEDLAGEILIKFEDNVYETLNTSIENPIFSTKGYNGVYILHYTGYTNSVEFGPVGFTVTTSGLVLDQIFLGVRITIHALG